MLAKYLAVVFLPALAVANVPSYIMICGRRNPNLDRCMQEAGNALRDKIKAGIPEVDLPPQDLVHIKEFSVYNTNLVKISVHDAKIRGLGDYLLQRIHFDFKRQQMNLVLSYKKIIIDGTYELNSTITIPIAGRAPIHIESNDVIGDTTLRYKHYKKNGADYIHYFSVTTSLTLKNWTASVVPTMGIDSTLVQAANAVIKEVPNEIFEALKPGIEKVISEYALEIGNKIRENMSFDEMFPDRE